MRITPFLYAAKYWALLAMLTLVTGPAQAQYASVDTYIIGATVSNVAVGDLNGDGNLDIVTTSRGIQVLFGQANGKFDAPRTYDATLGGRIALGDVNGDGRLDIVTCQYGSMAGGMVSILLGQGGDNFSSTTSYLIGALNHPVWIALGDVNGDGHLDIVTANYENDTVSVLAGQAGGGFATASYYVGVSGGKPYCVALGDMNGDGLLDIVTTNELANTVSVLLASGGSGFAPAKIYPTGAASNPYGNAQQLALGDVNKDGRLDIVINNSYNVSVLIGEANGNLAPFIPYSIGNHSNTSYAVQLGDMNGDGYLDIVTSSDTNVDILLGQAGGGFAAVQNFSRGNFLSDDCETLALGDLNGDGQLDIVTANGMGNTISVLLSTKAVLATTQPGSALVEAQAVLFPNPVAGSTNLAFTLGKAAHVELIITDALGRTIDTIKAGLLPAGQQNIRWNRQRQAAGIYFFSLRFDGQPAGTRRGVLAE
ncbi:T9SS type A sorting domain-containing protein [Hymenobacter sp. BRD67]|uniref:T9SS type A sorting domain-containing protein n=1 Tax=Hymenobacter sp. BRD67 TaxID=2675877 RepID=UPI0015648D9C|nr:T9SS type A sorting domain-containing protein [Hymenobacter sp. BRD67]QKG54402.1 T9SS type A sorting domain-containing protein [Hymenobacter sp. BRD67]